MTTPDPGRNAGGPIRLAAFVLDQLTFGLPYFVLNAFVLHMTNPMLQRAGGGLIATLYFTILWSSIGGGRTVGMRILGLKVVRTDGSELGIGRAFLRNVGLIVSIAPLFIGALWVLWDPRRQSWADKIADTFVVRAR